MEHKEFKVWAPENEDPEDADIVFGFLAEVVAEKWAEDAHARLEYPDEIEVHVQDPDGTVTVWTVACEMVLRCTASEKKGREGS